MQNATRQGIAGPDEYHEIRTHFVTEWQAISFCISEPAAEPVGGGTILIKGKTREVKNTWLRAVRAGASSR